jgi:predicted O-linked N-acetylglucosamine transferase (SPINDLY family)
MSTEDASFVLHLRLAWQRSLDFVQLFDCAEKLELNGQRELAAILYQTWLDRNNTSVNAFVYFNLGVVLFGMGDIDSAKAAYLNSIELMPSFLQSHFNLGIIYERINQHKAAIAEWLYVATNASTNDVAERSLRRQALNNLGRLYENERAYGDALLCLTQSLELEPDQPDVLHHWVFLRAKQCAWPVYAPIEGVDQSLMRRSTSALAMIALSDAPEEQLLAAKHYVDSKLDLNVPVLHSSRKYNHDKIRVAYLSSDFCQHPVGMLTVELFELHDRERFEVYGYCWSRDDGSEIRQRIINGVDHLERINGLSDESAARLIREHEIDILIDLQGQTLGARPGILSYRPAPIQITYLGLPATTGQPFIDYIIADSFLIPEESARFYSEKPLYMPDVYQVSDRKRACAPIPSRESCGLPPDAFVFCSFNNNYKYNQEMFAVWMRILRRVPNSVLWLLADNSWAEENLRKEVAKHGIDAGRVIFAPRVEPGKYLARYGVADLFLDSFPFNAGTTANDALWMSLPVITCSGRSFASRMAGALLTAAGLDCLITYNLKDYEEKAVALAKDPEQCRDIREVLRLAKESGPLFDTQRFVRNLESQFERLATAHI